MANPQGWRPGWFSPVFGVSAGDVGAAAIITSIVVTSAVAGLLFVGLYRRKHGLQRLATFVPVSLPGFSPALGARPDAVALAHSSPRYLLVALLSLAHFPLSFWAVYDVWGTARSADYGRFTCPATPSTSCWRYDEHLHQVRSCTWLFATREPCAVLSSIVPLWTQSRRGDSATVPFRDAWSTVTAFVCAQAACCLTLLVCALTFLLHQQVRRKLTQLQHGPAAATALCTSADSAALRVCCLRKSLAGDHPARPTCEDTCDPFGSTRMHAACRLFARCGNARCVAVLHAATCVLYSLALIVGGCMIDREGLRAAAGLQLARGFYICAYLTAGQWLCALLTAWQYWHLRKADLHLKNCLAIDPFTALPVLGSGPGYAWLSDVLYGAHPASLTLARHAIAQQSEEISQVVSPLHASSAARGARRSSSSTLHQGDAVPVPVTGRQQSQVLQTGRVQVLNGIAVPDTLAGWTSMVIPVATPLPQPGVVVQSVS